MNKVLVSFTNRIINYKGGPKMAERILLTPEELREAAEFLKSTKEDIVERVNQVSSKIDDVAANWEGASQSTFVDNYSSIKPTLDTEFPDVIEGLAEQLKAVADTLEEADEAVASSMAM